MGRPTKYTDETAAKICARIADGESVRSITSDADMPDQSVVYDWLKARPDFAEQYTRAREAQADFYADQIIKIADDGENDTYVDDDGQPRTDHDVIARSRLRVDARKWVASKLAPKKYGDKVAVGGADDLPPVNMSLSVEFVKARGKG